MTKSIEDFSEILQRDEPLSKHTWLKLGGPAQYFVSPRTEAELLEVITTCRSQQLPIHILGSGSNLLVRETGVQGVVIKVIEPLLAEVHVEGTSLTAAHCCRMLWQKPSALAWEVLNTLSEFLAQSPVR